MTAAKRQLEETGLQVTTLGYGAMELRGAPRARDITEEQAETILNKVLDSGINYIAGTAESDRWRRCSRVRAIPRSSSESGRGTDDLQTHRWRKPDSNHQYEGRATIGSLPTPRWRRQSRANPSLDAKFPASWENTGNFARLSLRPQ